MKIRTIGLDSLLRFNVITALTILLARIGSWAVHCLFGIFHPRFHLFSNVSLRTAFIPFLVGCSRSVFVMGFFGFFLDADDLVSFWWLLPPPASKSVHCTDLVDVSESCWGEKKVTCTFQLSRTRRSLWSVFHRTLQPVMLCSYDTICPWCFLSTIESLLVTSEPNGFSALILFFFAHLDDVTPEWLSRL